MPLMIKPRSLGLMARAERRETGASYIISAFGLFDLAEPDRFRLQSEQAMWLMVAKELPPGAIFDAGMPKPTAEILLGGHAAAPGGQPVQRMGLAWAIGDLQKRLLVTGDRVWRLAGTTPVPTEPAPFIRMPLIPARCFGGPGHPANPEGVGFRAQERLMARETVALPNIETPETAIRAIGDQPAPPAFGATAADSRERLQYAGTYDAAWLKTLAPGLAADADPRLFLFGPPDQRLPGYLNGDEGYGLRNFAADAPEIRQHLPGFRVRCFVGWVDPSRPPVEVSLRIDTLWLFAGARRGVMVYRGAVPIADFEAADVADVMVAYERMIDEPRPASHYLGVRALRTNPETAFKYALSEHQLVPPAPAELVAARHAERKERAAEQRRRQHEQTTWIMAQELARSGLPKEQWPALDPAEPEDLGLPMPTPSELESGDFDLAEMLDALEDVQTRKMAELDQMIEARQPVMDAMQQIASGEADPGVIDKLLALLDQPDVAARLDAEIANVPSVGAFEADPDVKLPAETAAALDRIGDWRRAILDGAAPEIDEDEQLAQARAHFLDLPEGKPMAQARRQLTQDRFTLPAIDLSDVGAPASAATPPAGDDDMLANALRALEGDPDMPASAAEDVRSALGKAEAELARMMPNLPGPSRLQSLLARPPAPPAGAAPAGEVGLAMGDRLAAAGAQAHAALDDADAQIIPALAEMRRLSPEPMKPDVPLTGRVASAFGALVVEQLRAGVSLAGRDLAGVDLSGVDLTGVDFSGALMERARLDGARLAGALLSGATLCGASLRGADLSGCDLTKTNLCKVDGEGARFVGARLIDTEMLGARFAGASFEGAEISRLILLQIPLTRASFARARLSDLILMRCDIEASDWRGVEAARVQMLECPLGQARFAGAALHEVCILGGGAREIDFSDSRLSSVAFIGDLDMAGASFARVEATGLSFLKTDLSDADFSEGRFEKLSLTQTTLPRARLRLASLKRALFARNNLTGTDFFAANLLEAQFNRADLTGARLRAANLFGADLADATLFGADFSRANLGRTILMVASDGD